MTRRLGKLHGILTETFSLTFQQNAIFCVLYCLFVDSQAESVVFHLEIFSKMFGFGQREANIQVSQYASPLSHKRGFPHFPNVAFMLARLVSQHVSRSAACGHGLFHSSSTTICMWPWLESEFREALLTGTSILTAFLCPRNYRFPARSSQPDSLCLPHTSSPIGCFI